MQAVYIQPVKILLNTGKLSLETFEGPAADQGEPETVIKLIHGFISV